MFMRVSYPDSLRTMDEVLSDFFIPSSSRNGVFPAVDVAEYDDNYEMVVELPGVRKDDLKVSVEKGVLTVSGERKANDFPEGTKVLHHETHTHPFSRSFDLPGEVKANEISAELKEGVLRIRLPKAEQARPREIQIQ